MRYADAFDGAEFLGLARHGRRDPYRLELFARHLDADEAAAAVLPVIGGTLVVTDRRILRLTSHLEVDGAWNVREFHGYAVSLEVALADVKGAWRASSADSAGVGDIVVLETAAGAVELILSTGPESIVSDEDAARLIALLTRRSPSRGSPSGASPGRARSPG